MGPIRSMTVSAVTSGSMAARAASTSGHGRPSSDASNVRLSAMVPSDTLFDDTRSPILVPDLAHKARGR